MYDPISLSVLHRLQWLSEANRLRKHYIGAYADLQYDLGNRVGKSFRLRDKANIVGEIVPRLNQISYAATRCEHYYVEEHFRQLAAFAAESIPLDTVFDETMLITPSGWMEIENGVVPVGCGETDRLHIFIWFKNDHDPRYQFKFIRQVPPFTEATKLKDDDMLWSDFGITPGETLESLLARVPTAQGYAQFVMCLLHLLGQRMTIAAPAQPRANVTGRAKSCGVDVSGTKIIMLRRAHQERTEAATAGRAYEFQWHVRGHWRRQPYKSTGEVRPIFIDAYIKGPDDKPLKPLTHPIFVGRR